MDQELNSRLCAIEAMLAEVLKRLPQASYQPPPPNGPYMPWPVLMPVINAPAPGPAIAPIGPPWTITCGTGEAL